MALKTCPHCKKKIGPRSKICKFCKKDVSLNTQDKNAVSQGYWLLDLPKGFKAPSAPEPLPQKAKLTKEDLQRYISYEGLGYCIQDYIDSSRIKDKKVAKLWDEANEVMKKIIGIVYE